MTYTEAVSRARDSSKDGANQNVCVSLRRGKGGEWEVDPEGYTVSDWYDGSTVVSYSNGRISFVRGE